MPGASLLLGAECRPAVDELTLAVDTRSAVPPYEQIRLQLVDALKSGFFRAGERLPSIRQLAGDLGLATNTVGRAFKELESEGFIESRGPLGSFVGKTKTLGRRDRRVRLNAVAQNYVLEVKRLGVDSSDALDAVRVALGSR